MTVAVVIAVLASAILHAAWNALLKRTRDTEAAAVIVVLGASTVSGALAFVIGPSDVPVASVPWLLGAGVIEGVYFVSLAAALARLPLQSAYGVSRGLGVLLVWPMSILMLSEHASPLSLLGATLLSLGLFIQMRSVPRSVGLTVAIVCAVSIACYPLAYKRAIQAGISPYSLFALSLAMSLPAQLAILGRQRLMRVRAAASAEGRVLAACALCCAASFLIFLHALKTAGPAHVSAMRNTSVLFASMFAWARGEPFDARSLASAAAITIGAVCVAL